jgi:hypothetical protein
MHSYAGRRSTEAVGAGGTLLRVRTEPGAGRGELTTALETGRPLLLPRRGLALQLAALGEQTADGVAVTALPVL